MDSLILGPQCVDETVATARLHCNNNQVAAAMVGMLWMLDRRGSLHDGRRRLTIERGVMKDLMSAAQIWMAWPRLMRCGSLREEKMWSVDNMAVWPVRWYDLLMLKARIKHCACV